MSRRPGQSMAVPAAMPARFSVMIPAGIVTVARACPRTSCD
jgi:hypothetical protein